MLVAALDRLEANRDHLYWPVPFTPVKEADGPGWCAVCGTNYDVKERIVHATWPDKSEDWVHAQCPPLWEVYAANLEKEDGALITYIGILREPFNGWAVRIRQARSRFTGGEHSKFMSLDQAKEEGYM
jgi:hypothetical protein